MVKLAVSVIFATALASSLALAQESVENVDARDIVAPSAEQDLFGRAAAKVMNNLFSREDLNEMLGRDVEELTQRDIDELFEREVEVDEMLAARQEEGAEGAPAPEESGAEPTEDKPAPKPKGGAQQPLGAPTKDPKNTAVASQDPKPNHSLGGFILSWFRKAVTAPKNAANKDKANKAPAKKDAAAKAPKKEAAAAPAAAPAPAAGEAPAEGQEQEARELEEPIERSLDFADELSERDVDELVEARELLEAFDDVYERELEMDDELLEREFEDDIFEREFEDETEVLERDFEDDVFERDFEEDVLERELGEEWDDELLRRAFDVVEELEQLD